MIQPCTVSSPLAADSWMLSLGEWERFVLTSGHVTPSMLFDSNSESLLRGFNLIKAES